MKVVKGKVDVDSLGPPATMFCNEGLYRLGVLIRINKFRLLRRLRHSLGGRPEELARLGLLDGPSFGQHSDNVCYDKRGLSGFVPSENSVEWEEKNDLDLRDGGRYQTPFDWQKYASNFGDIVNPRRIQDEQTNHGYDRRGSEVHPHARADRGVDGRHPRDVDAGRGGETPGGAGEPAGDDQALGAGTGGGE